MKYYLLDNVIIIFDFSFQFIYLLNLVNDMNELNWWTSSLWWTESNERTGGKELLCPIASVSRADTPPFAPAPPAWVRARKKKKKVD